MELKDQTAECTLRNKSWSFTNMRIGLLLNAILVSYIATGSAGIFDAFVPVQRLYSYNKYVIVILVIMLLLKTLIQRSRLKMPGIMWFGVFMICALLHGLYPGGQYWYIILKALLKIYVLYLIIINYFKTREDFEILGISFVVISVITLGAYYYSYRYMGLLVVIETSRSELSDEMGFSININTISYLSALVYIVYCNLFKDRNSLWYFPVQVLLFIGLAWIIIINGSRGAALILAAVVLLGLPRMRKWKTIVVSIGIILLFGHIISSPSDYVQPVVELERFIQRVDLVKSFQEGERTYIAKYAFSKLLEGPLWGKGYYSVIGSGGYGVTNHLWWLNLAVAYGIIGLLIFLIWFIQATHIRILLFSRYSIMFLIFIFVFFFFAPPVVFLSVVMAFLYHESNRELVNKTGISKVSRFSLKM